MDQTHVDGFATGKDPDDQELSAEEATESKSAWQSHMAGADPGQLLDQVRRDLLGDCQRLSDVVMPCPKC